MAVLEAQFEELVKRVERLEEGLHRLEAKIERGEAPALEVAVERLRATIRCCARQRLRA